MTCADQTMIRRAPPRAGLLATLRHIARMLRRFSWPRVGRLEDLNDQMMRDVGLGDGQRTEERMRRDLNCGQPFDQLRF